MAKTNSKPTSPNSYELLGLRVQKLITTPVAQKRRSVLVNKMPDECPDDWSRLLDDIAETENVSLSRDENGGALVSWSVPANI
ncbi:DUF1654 domain-containing protein [Pseudomonas sp. NPDC098747]|uniref:DUF1654 domain-containing protein n=1 Tax=Pseudomonas sp. NPDC098747 TaxID=3364487 RepID=UPI00383A2B75